MDITKDHKHRVLVHKLRPMLARGEKLEGNKKKYNSDGEVTKGNRIS